MQTIALLIELDNIVATLSLPAIRTSSVEFGRYLESLLCLLLRINIRLSVWPKLTVHHVDN